MKIHLIKNQIKNIQTKQIDDEVSSLFSSKDEIIEPNFDFETLLQVYENSSIISWIIWKIALKSATKFKKTNSENLDKVLAKLDLETLFLDLLVFWNTFFERLKNKKSEKTLEFNHILAPTFRVADKKSKFDFFQRSKSWMKKIWFMENEILFFKRNSISSKYYWDSIFSSSIDEIILLNYITTFFKKYFKSGNINPTILFSEDSNLTDEQLEKVENLIRDSISGIENADRTIMLGTKVWKIDLATIFDPEKYISLKRELKEDIAIDLNIPFDLLSSESSNRATSQTSMEILYSNIIIPLQEKIEQQLKNQFKKWFLEEVWEACWQGITEKDIEMIEFEDINLKNPKEEMETLTWYLKNWVLSVNEVRQIARLWASIEWWDDYKIIWWSSLNSENEGQEMEKIRENLEKIWW